MKINQNIVYAIGLILILSGCGGKNFNMGSLSQKQYSSEKQPYGLGKSRQIFWTGSSSCMSKDSVHMIKNRKTGTVLLGPAKMRGYCPQQHNLKNVAQQSIKPVPSAEVQSCKKPNDNYATLSGQVMVAVDRKDDGYVVDELHTGKKFVCNADSVESSVGSDFTPDQNTTAVTEFDEAIPEADQDLTTMEQPAKESSISDAVADDGHPHDPIKEADQLMEGVDENRQEIESSNKAKDFELKRPGK